MLARLVVVAQGPPIEARTRTVVASRGDGSRPELRSPCSVLVAVQATDGVFLGGGAVAGLHARGPGQEDAMPTQPRLQIDRLSPGPGGGRRRSGVLRDLGGDGLQQGAVDRLELLGAIQDATPAMRAVRYVVALPGHGAVDPADPSGVADRGVHVDGLVRVEKMETSQGALDQGQRLGIVREVDPIDQVGPVAG